MGENSYFYSTIDYTHTVAYLNVAIIPLRPRSHGRAQNAWTKEELQQEIMMLQTKWHEHAIAGEFTPEKLDEMRRTMYKKPEKEEHVHFAKMHPGVGDDDDLE